MRSALLLLAPPALLALARPARADEVLLVTGERLVGKVQALVGGKMTFVSEGVGAVSIDLAKIRTFATDAPVEIRFKDGTVVNQAVRGAEEGRVAIERAGVLEAQSLPLAEIASINPPKAKWTGSISAGFQATRGNSYTQSTNVDAAANRRGEDDRLSFAAFYASSEQHIAGSGEHTTSTVRNGGGSLQYDLFFSPKFYGNGFAKAQRDDIAFLDLRFQAGVGIGYQWVERDDLKFKTEGGVTWISENYSDGTESVDQIGARVAYGGEKKFGTGATLFHSAEWFPGLEEPKDHYVTAVGGLRTSLTKAMFAEGKVVWDWDSTPAATAARTNVRYILGLGLTF